MDEQELLKRYYRGETNLEEERKLKNLYRKGELRDEPILAFKGQAAKIPEDLTEKFRLKIQREQKQTYRNRWAIGIGIAASLILIVSLRNFIPINENSNLQLSNNLKKERFENALRTIGSVLEEGKTDPQQVLYEDNKLIITIE